ncbi:MAG: CarD family transcriptional regulator [Synergistaceae bacterium]|jgi:CarD family transcriptional regulator|nr:CarD family transcriptional regulator [Synergistaceae bacterium]
MDYRIGDLVVYEGSNSVCRIIEITRLDMPKVDKERMYYVMKPLNQDCLIYNPTDNTNMRMRPLITKDDAKRLIDMIPGMKVEPYQGSDLRAIAEHCRSILKTRDCAKLIELTMSIYLKKQFSIKNNRKFSSQEDMFMKQAEEMLFGELSAALDIPKEQVKSYISEKVSGQQDDAGKDT